jgi:hypothetical protein
MLLLLSVVAPFEAEVFDEPGGFVVVVESVESEVLDEPEASPASVEIEGEELFVELEGLSALIELVETNLTASAQVDSELELETMTTFAVPEKVYVPRKFH